MLDLRDDRCRRSQVDSREAQDLVSGVHEGILPTQVGYQPISVIFAVVLDHQPTIRVVEVRTPE